MSDWNHFGHKISISGFSGVGLSGERRHPDDTDETLHLTLYGQDGELRTLRVPRTRDGEMFQEWLRRFDRYTPRSASGMEARSGETAKTGSTEGDSPTVEDGDAPNSGQPDPR